MDIQIPGVRSLEQFSQSSAPTRSVEDELGRTAFLELMIAQVQNQDPLEPAKNEAFIAQLAQFSSVEGIQNMNESMDSLVASLRSGLTMDAAGLVGRNVLIPSDQTGLNTRGGIGGSIEISEPASNVIVEIQNSSGQPVSRKELGTANPGNLRFDWDGRTATGEQADNDYYRISAYAEVDGNLQPLVVNLPDQIVSVSIADGGLIANLAGGNSVPAVQIREIQ